MIARVIKTEVSLALRGGGLIPALLCLAAFLILAWTFNAADRNAEQGQVAASQAEARKHWLEQGEKNPHNAGHYGLYVFKSLPFMAMIDPGVRDYVGTTVFVEAHRKNDATLDAVRDQSAIARLGDLTPAFVLYALTPLVMILFGYGVVAREREMGVLRFVAAAGVAPRQYLMAKYLARAILPVAVVIGFFVVVRIGAAINGIALSEGRFWMLSLASLLYLLVFQNLIFAVSLRCQRAATALLILLGVWTLSVLVAPKLAVNGNAWLFPDEQRSALQAKISESIAQGLEGEPDARARGEQLRADIFAEYNVTSTEELPINFDGVRMQAGEEYGNRVIDHHYQEVLDRQDRQDRLYQGFSLLSPTLPMRVLSMGLAGVDHRAHWLFDRQVETYRRDFNKILNDEMTYNSLTGDWAYQSDASVWAKVPDFVETEPTFGQAWRGVEFGILLLWFALGAWLAFGPAATRLARGW